MTTSVPPVKIELNFMERDTLLACLKDMIKIKTQIAELTVTEKEKTVIRQQAEIAQNLYDRIYEQKLEECKNGF